MENKDTGLSGSTDGDPELIPQPEVEFQFEDLPSSISLSSEFPIPVLLLPPPTLSPDNMEPYDGLDFNNPELLVALINFFNEDTEDTANFIRALCSVQPVATKFLTEFVAMPDYNERLNGIRKIISEDSGLNFEPCDLMMTPSEEDDIDSEAYAAAADPAVVPSPSEANDIHSFPNKKSETHPLPSEAKCTESVSFSPGKNNPTQSTVQAERNVTGSPSTAEGEIFPSSSQAEPTSSTNNGNNMTMEQRQQLFKTALISMSALDHNDMANFLGEYFDGSPKNDGEDK